MSLYKTSIDGSIARTLNHKLFWFYVGVLSDVDEIKVIKHLFILTQKFMCTVKLCFLYMNS